MKKPCSYSYLCSPSVYCTPILYSSRQQTCCWCPVITWILNWCFEQLFLHEGRGGKGESQTLIFNGLLFMSETKWHTFSSLTRCCSGVNESRTVTVCALLGIWLQHDKSWVHFHSVWTFPHSMLPIVWWWSCTWSLLTNPVTVPLSFIHSSQRELNIDT